jgi:carbon storage regulator CsrA
LKEKVMLFLDRKRSQNIVIWTEDGLRIIVQVHRVKGGTVSVGVEAPHGIHVDREEIFERKTAGKVCLP